MSVKYFSIQDSRTIYIATLLVLYMILAYSITHFYLAWYLCA